MTSLRFGTGRTRSCLLPGTPSVSRPEIAVPRSSGTPEGTEIPEEPAVRLARLALEARDGLGDSDPVLSVLADAAGLLHPLGTRIEIVRTKPGCAVIRATAAAGVHDAGWCPQVARFLKALPHVAYGSGSLIESTCLRRGGRACLFTLLWDSDIPTIGPDTSAVGPDTSLLALSEAGTLRRDRSAPVSIPELAAPPATVEAPAWSDGSLQAPTQPLPVQPTRAKPTRAQPDPTQPTRPGDPVRPAASQLRRSADRHLIPVWARRSGWLVVLAAIAGLLGGMWAGGHQVMSYRAQATLVVQSGASATGPGSAGEAGALAITYATVIPTDSSLLNRAASSLGVSESTVASSLTTSVDTGTAVLVLSYTAPSAAKAIAAASTIAQLIGDPTSPSSTIPTGTVSVIHLPTGATTSGSLAKYGEPIGGLIGIAVGLILVLAVERANPRIDSAGELADVVGCPASSVPHELSVAELSRAMAFGASCPESIAVVPLSRRDQQSSAALAMQLQSSWPAEAARATVQLSPPFESDPVAEGSGTSPTVLMVRAGESVHRVRAAAERLQTVARTPIWAVLVTRQNRQKLVAGGV